MSAGAQRRVFFALWPPARVAHALAAHAERAQALFGGRRMRTETLHQTLAFIGAVEAERLAALEAAAGAVRAPAFALALDQLGCWPHKRIAWAGTGRSPPEVQQLASDLGSRLAAIGIELDDRPFAVHVTLLRSARCPGGAEHAMQPVVWPVEEFVLVESRLSPQGAHYEVLRRWALGA